VNGGSFTDSVQRAIQLEKFCDDITIGHTIAGWTRVRYWFNDLKLDQEIDVVADCLSGNASVLCEL
jgi:hypothetical protein